MSVPLPEFVEVARMVQARRSFQGRLPLASMPRLCESLAAVEGEAVYDLEFGSDVLGGASLTLHVEAGLPLTCQRTLETYVQPVTVDQRFGLIAREGEEAALPDGYEAVLVVEGRVHLREVIEDELILALPLVPLAPGEPLHYSAEPDGAVDVEEEPHVSPFAVLGEFELKKH